MACAIKDLLTIVLPKPRDWKMLLTWQWAQAVGNLHEHMRLERIEGTTLVLGVYDSHWMQELFMLSSVIIKTVNEYLGSPQVMRVRFVLVKKTDDGDPSQRKLQEAVSRKSQLKKGTSQMGSRHEEVLRSIKDEQLQKILKSFFHRCVV